jgi:hypothetical protein
MLNRPLLLLLALSLSTCAAMGGEPAPPPGNMAAEAGSPRDLETYGEADATCLEWSNGCQVCRRQPEGGWACSTPGIACVPEPVTCRGR